VGGGNWPHPGEISLAHRGVLFLDELPEFGPRVLEVMRQPIEDKIVTISRAQGSLTFPANFQLMKAPQLAQQHPPPMLKEAVLFTLLYLCRRAKHISRGGRNLSRGCANWKTCGNILRI
jgi:transcriptional regulator with AAA-type ATPase domain